MKDENALYWLWLSEKCGVASKEFGRLIARFENPFELYRMESEEIEQIEGIGDRLKGRLSDKSLESAYTILRYCKQNKVKIIPYGDEKYPARLRNIEDPPALLYCLGDLPDMNSGLCIGIVGTRKMSEYGKESGYRISYELASAGAVIVSGMALGVDGVCACGALSAGGKTVAVLGCGISVVYPREHEKLMHEIARHGAVVTEYPPSERPLAGNFPKRNRLISGLCQGVLVVEAARGSGALITASRAIAQGRELFALPGKVGESNSDGPNELIQSGAHMALSAEDIVRHYDFLYHDVISYKGLAKAGKYTGHADDAMRRYGVSYRSCHTGYGEAGNRVSRGAEISASNVMSENTVQKKAPETLKKQTDEESTGSKGSADNRETTEKKDRSGLEETGKIENTCFSDQHKIEKILSSLDDTSRAVFEKMPVGRAVTPDLLLTEKLGIGEVITSLTMLELSGLVSSLPGGLYIRK